MAASTPPFWLGGVAASVAACCTHPLDLTKVRMQTMGSSGRSIAGVVKLTLSESGVRSLYTGLSASLLRQMSYSLVRLGSYEKFKQWLAQGNKPTTSQLLIAGGLAGGLGGLMGNPADVLLVRMTTDSLKPASEQHRYGNALRGLYILSKSEGTKGLARGLLPNTIRAVLMNMSQLASYDFFKTKILEYGPVAGYRMTDGLLVHSLASTMAGVIATTVTAPADVIKSRLMASASNQSNAEVLVQSLRNEGIGILFRGWVPAFVRLGPNTILLFVTLEQLKSFYRRTFQ